jgi:predicted MFS family arabinose efflux permease
MKSAIKNYLVVTGSYWGFTITDGAIRMLVVLYFHQLGYSPLAIASLFLFYEFFGVVTNLVGGWIGARLGLNTTLLAGMVLQVIALSMLTVDASWLTVPYVMLAQAISGIAKDLNKMSAKAGVKLFLPESHDTKLFKWVAFLTGSKNALKGTGFFIGGFLLTTTGFRGALIILSGSLLAVLVLAWILLPEKLGKTQAKPKFSQIFSKSKKINMLSAARFFLFGSRDIWFVVGLPVFLSSSLAWSHTQVGTFLASWVIGYGVIQAIAPRLVRMSHQGSGPDGNTSVLWVFILLFIPAAMALILDQGRNTQIILVAGLAIYGAVFAINSSIHSYLIVSWSERENVSMNVGFYYMANAAGRLIGTILSGLAYQNWGITGCLWFSSIFLVFSLCFTLPLTKKETE